MKNLNNIAAAILLISAAGCSGPNWLFQESESDDNCERFTVVAYLPPVVAQLDYKITSASRNQVIVSGGYQHVLSIPAPDDGHLEAKINPGFNSFPLDLPDTAIQAKETVLFKFDQSSIDVAEIEKLDHLIASLKNIDLMHIRIEGHTDAKGAEGYNQKLSSKRAGAVEKYLVSNGIEASKISKKGFGESMPVVPNDTDFNRAKNRRAELIPITSD